MKIGVPRETSEGERRVATTPAVVEHLTKLGFDVAIQAGAGAAANYPDEAYAAAGCVIVDSATELWATSDIVLKVQAPNTAETALLKSGQVLISFLWPAQHPELLEDLERRGVTAIAMDSIPRISRAQKMDARSSMSNVSGYRAIVEAEENFGRFFAGQITAAGKVPPAKVLVIGAGVAGLEAIGTAKSLGAIVRSFDTRPEVKEQIESMDAEFLMLDFAQQEEAAGEGGYAKVMSDAFIQAEMTLFGEQAKDVDIIVTTALIPGKPAPRLLTAEMVASMRDGSVIVDLAAEQGGNCELTVPGEVVVRHGVSIVGYTDLPSRMATQSSQLYGTNLRHLLAEMTPDKDGELVVDMENEVIRGATVCLRGEITWPPPAPTLSVSPEQAPLPDPVVPPPAKKSSGLGFVAAVVFAVLGLIGLGSVAPPDFLVQVTVLVLASFVAYLVIWNVSPTLHTSLMSMNNAISSVIVIGALLQISSGSTTAMWLAVFALGITSINIVGGFAVTHRMLRMFKETS